MIITSFQTLSVVSFLPDMVIISDYPDTASIRDCVHNAIVLDDINTMLQILSRIERMSNYNTILTSIYDHLSGMTHINDRIFNLIYSRIKKIHSFTITDETVDKLILHGCVESYESILNNISPADFEQFRARCIDTIKHKILHRKNKKLIRLIIGDIDLNDEKSYNDFIYQSYTENVYDCGLFDNDRSRMFIMANGCLRAMELVIDSIDGIITNCYDVLYNATWQNGYPIFVKLAPTCIDILTNEQIVQLIHIAIRVDNVDVVRSLLTMSLVTIEMIMLSIEYRTIKSFTHLTRSDVAKEHADEIITVIVNHPYDYMDIARTNGLKISLNCFRQLNAKFSISLEFIAHNINSVFLTVDDVISFTKNRYVYTSEGLREYEIVGDISRLLIHFTKSKKFQAIKWCLEKIDPTPYTQQLNDITQQWVNPNDMLGRIAVHTFIEDKRVMLTNVNHHIDMCYHTCPDNVVKYYKYHQRKIIFDISSNFTFPLLVQYTIFEQAISWIPNKYRMTMWYVWEIMKLITKNKKLCI